MLAHRAQLDEQPANGVDPHSGDRLVLRAGSRPAHRLTVAKSLEDALACAERPTSRVSPAVPLAKRDIYASRAALLGLCSALREDIDANPAGVALAQRLLTDGSGPLYREGHHDALWHALREATAVLETAA